MRTGLPWRGSVLGGLHGTTGARGFAAKSHAGPPVPAPAPRARLGRMVFRVSHAADVVEAEVLGGVLRLELSATGLALQLPDRQLVLTGRELTLAYGRGGGRRDRKASFPLPGQLWIARDAPREDVGIWIAEDLGATRVRRVLGIEPRSLLEPGGLEALRALDRLTARLRQALADSWARRRGRSRWARASARSSSSRPTTTWRSSAAACSAWPPGACCWCTATVASSSATAPRRRAKCARALASRCWATTSVSRRPAAWTWHAPRCRGSRPRPGSIWRAGSARCSTPGSA
jgi:hypothetical protein